MKPLKIYRFYLDQYKFYMLSIPLLKLPFCWSMFGLFNMFIFVCKCLALFVSDPHILIYAMACVAIFSVYCVIDVHILY